MRVSKMTPRRRKALTREIRNQIRQLWNGFGVTGTGDWRLRDIPSYGITGYDRMLLEKDAKRRLRILRKVSAHNTPTHLGIDLG